MKARKILGITILGAFVAFGIALLAALAVPPVFTNPVTGEFNLANGLVVIAITLGTVVGGGGLLLLAVRLITSD